MGFRLSFLSLFQPFGFLSLFPSPFSFSARLTGEVLPDFGSDLHSGTALALGRYDQLRIAQCLALPFRKFLACFRRQCGSYLLNKLLATLGGYFH